MPFLKSPKKFGQIKKGAVELYSDHPGKLCAAAPERDCIYGIRKIRVHIFVLITILFPSHLCRYKKKNTIDANFFRVASIVFSKDGGDGGIRTHVPVRINAFRERRVTTASLRLLVYSSAPALRAKCRKTVEMDF